MISAPGRSWGASCTITIPPVFRAVFTNADSCIGEIVRRSFTSASPPFSSASGSATFRTLHHLIEVALRDEDGAEPASLYLRFG
jgi:hypothetical protein